MGRYHDNSGVSNTCPLINEVIDFVGNLDYEDILPYEKTKIINILEQIRSMNLSLRDWGNEQCNLNESNEKEVDYLTRQITSLEQEIDYFKMQLASSERRVEELEGEL